MQQCRALFQLGVENDVDVPGTKDQIGFNPKSDTSIGGTYSAHVSMVGKLSNMQVRSRATTRGSFGYRTSADVMGMHALRNFKPRSYLGSTGRHTILRSSM